MGFYEFDQNNSGGSFHVDDVFCHSVWIEAVSLADATRQFLDMGGYFDGVTAGLDCGCCGDRWSEPYREKTFPIDWDKTHTLETLEEYLLFVSAEYGKYFDKIYRVFYADRTMSEFQNGIQTKNKVEG